jgi:hypothetical protein
MANPLNKAKEDKLLPPEQRKAFREARRDFDGKDILAGQVTTVPGVSYRGIEARRSDLKIPESQTIAHGYARTGRPLKEQREFTKKYFRSILDAQKKQPKPMLKNEHNPMDLWQSFKDEKTKTVGYNHPVHGMVSINQHPETKQFQLKHNENHIGSFATPKEAILYLPKYIKSFVTDTAPHGPSWKKQKSELQKTYPPSPQPSTPVYRSPASNTPGINPQAAKEMERGANWSTGQTLSNIKENFRNIPTQFGMNPVWGKGEKSDKPFHGYNKNKHSKTGGLKDSYRKKINREEGSNLKRPVTGKVKPGSKAAKRRKSFCARMSGVKGPTSKEGKLTPKGAALKRWKCSKSELIKSDNYFRYQLQEFKKSKSAFEKPHFIFSAENPVTEPQLKMSTDEVLSHLRQMGEHAEKIQGVYGKPEQSIFIHQPKNLEKLHEFAKKLGQESAIHSTDGKHEMHYYNGLNAGKIRHGLGTQTFSEKPEDYYSTMLDPSGKEIHFSHNFDWDDKNLSDSLKKNRSQTRLIHYSTQPNLKEIDPKFMGSGLGSQGAESKHSRPDVERSYFYREGSEPEDIVTQKAKFKYSAQLEPHHTIYDIGVDPENIKQRLELEAQNRQINPGVVSNDEYLQAVKDAGYHGFFNSQSGLPDAVALFHKHPVTQITEKSQNYFYKKINLLRKNDQDHPKEYESILKQSKITKKSKTA